MDIGELVEKNLELVFPENSGDTVIDAARYSLLAGGKRLRPRMMFMTSKLLTGEDTIPEDVMYYAVTLEMIHTYSLIHDDLPCMDNDDLRRGLPTCHIKFGEGFATLAGDTLLNSAMERLLKMTYKKPEYSYASYRMAELAGISGMIGGQSIDLMSEDMKIPLERLYELQAKKTGALIECAIVTPYYLFKADSFDPDNEDDICDALKRLAAHVGLAFQIRDDILDVISDPSVLGKSTGKDERDNKSTFVTLLGFEGASDRLDEEIGKALDVLSYLRGKGYDVNEYVDFVEYLKNRGT